MKKGIIVILIAAALAGGFIAWRQTRHDGRLQTRLMLYGNVDLRQVNLAFNGSERIDAILVQEGDRVAKGQVLGALQMAKLEASVARAEAGMLAQRHVLERLENGARPEEIEQARANVQASKTDLNNARRIFERLKKTAGSGASSQQDLENAQTAYEVAEARLRVNQKTLELAEIGPRKEEIAEARANLKAAEADLALLKQDLAYATLESPVNGIVQNRILEPGEMASPSRPVLTISIIDPKWVRAYVPEPDLGKIRNGMRAEVLADSFPGKVYEGWVGFISPVAEFTPKSVETTELRTSLVYEVRVFVKDPSDELRLGMPTTVRIPLSQEGSPSNAGASEKKANDGR